MTEVDEQHFKTMDGCHICGERYTDKDVRIRDHCHITGKFRGSAHQECNLKLRIKPENLKIPVIFHNLRGYDSHFIMQQIGEIANKHGYTNKKGEKQDLNINAIPNNMEKYIAFMLGNHLTFIDSFQFMSSSLDKLVSNLPKDDLIYTSKAFKGKRLDLLSKKGVYPYDFMDSFEKFNNRELPTKDQFYSIVNDEHVTDDEYDHAKKVWDTFYIKTMGEYHDLYLVSDMLLLTNVFENFRKTCMQYYKLDPCHYFTSPGLSWDAMLKMTNIKLELMTDIDMFQFIEKGMRGGVSYIANRYGNANKVKRWRRIRIGDHTRKPIRLTKTVAMDIRLYVATMTNIVNTLSSIEVKTLSTNLWKRCSKRLSTVKLSLKSISTNHWL